MTEAGGIALSTGYLSLSLGAVEEGDRDGGACGRSGAWALGGVVGSFQHFN